MEEVTINEKTGDKTITHEPKVIYAGGCDHNYVLAGEKESGLTPYSCSNCPNGILLADDWEVVDGKPARKETNESI